MAAIVGRYVNLIKMIEQSDTKNPQFKIQNLKSKIAPKGWILLDKDNISYYLSSFYQTCEPIA